MIYYNFSRIKAERSSINIINQVNCYQDKLQSAAQQSHHTDSLWQPAGLSDWRIPARQPLSPGAPHSVW